jgi:hypothetical protein
MRIFLIAVLMLGGCSPVMEANRPDPVDMSQFKPGEQHIDVVKILGPAKSIIASGANSCDVYQLYTRGPDSAGKAGIAFGEALVDIGTLGLAELIFTPVEVGTKNSLHTVILCYSPDGALASMEEEGAPVASAGK